MSPLYQTVISAFEGAGWKFAPVDGQEVIRAGFEAHHGRVDVHVQVFPELKYVNAVAESSVSFDDPIYRERLAELVMRTNKELVIGNFEMDWDSGRLLFRAGNLFASADGDPAIVELLVHTAIAEMDRITPQVTILKQTPLGALPSLDLAALMQRTDLLPPTPEPPAS